MKHRKLMVVTSAFLTFTGTLVASSTSATAEPRPPVPGLAHPGAAAPKAQASTTGYRITNPNTDGSFTATTSKTVTFKSSDGTINISCAAGTLSGTIDSWIGSRGDLTAQGDSFTAGSLTDCRGADGRTWNATWYTDVYPSRLRATSHSGGVTSIQATATLRLHDPAASCDIRFESFDGTYANAQLSFTSATVSSNGCTSSTAPFSVSLAYTVSPVITISQEPPSFSVSGNTRQNGEFSSVGRLQIQDVANRIDIANCSTASLSGTLPNADGVNGAFGTVTTETHDSCTTPDGEPVTIRVLDLPWTLKTEVYVVNRYGGWAYGPASATGQTALEVSWPGCSFRLVTEQGRDLHYWSALGEDQSFNMDLRWLPTDVTGSECGLIREGTSLIHSSFTGTLDPNTIRITAQ